MKKGMGKRMLRLQILEMDDDEETRDFSKEIVHSFFEQAEQAIKDMRNLL